MAGWTTVSGTSSTAMAILDMANTQGQSVLAIRAHMRMVPIPVVVNGSIHLSRNR